MKMNSIQSFSLLVPCDNSFGMSINILTNCVAMHFTIFNFSLPFLGMQDEVCLFWMRKAIWYPQIIIEEVGCLILHQLQRYLFPAFSFEGFFFFFLIIFFRTLGVVSLGEIQNSSLRGRYTILLLYSSISGPGCLTSITKI